MNTVVSKHTQLRMPSSSDPNTVSSHANLASPKICICIILLWTTTYALSANDSSCNWDVSYLWKVLFAYRLQVVRESDDKIRTLFMYGIGNRIVRGIYCNSLNTEQTTWRIRTLHEMRRISKSNQLVLTIKLYPFIWHFLFESESIYVTR